jgi:hypothetical protein
VSLCNNDNVVKVGWDEIHCYFFRGKTISQQNHSQFHSISTLALAGCSVALFFSVIL